MANEQYRFENTSFLLQDSVRFDIGPQKVNTKIRILVRELASRLYIDNLLCTIHTDAYKSSYIFFSDRNFFMQQTISVKLRIILHIMDAGQRSIVLTDVILMIDSEKLRSSSNSVLFGYQKTKLASVTKNVDSRRRKQYRKCIKRIILRIPK